nr:MAG TPA: hypothetical protein [Caudoviricetes sp.]
MKNFFFNISFHIYPFFLFIKMYYIIKMFKITLN